MTQVRRLFALCLLVAAGFGLAPVLHSTASAEATSPEKAAQFIADIGTRALGVLADRNASAAERETRVRALLDEGLDLAMIGKFALGRSWQTASEAQLSEYARLVRAYVLNTYGHRLAAYSGEGFKVTGAEPIAESDAIVISAVERANGEPVKVGWRVRAEEGGYKVVDVVIEGISLVVTQREEFASIVRQKGLDGLLDALRAQIRQFAADGAAAPAKE